MKTFWRSWWSWWKDMGGEVAARHRGAKQMSPEHRKVFTAARDIIGPTGWQWSNAWNRLEKDGDAYIHSFDPRVPPSLYVPPPRKRVANLPVPLAERCIEDWGKTHSPSFIPLSQGQPTQQA